MLEEDHTPISARLAEELKVTPPAVTAALKRMTRDGHVRVQRSGRIDLTQKGRKFAERLALRHQLAEMLLTEVIGLSWATVHDAHLGAAAQHKGKQLSLISYRHPVRRRVRRLRYGLLPTAIPASEDGVSSH